MGSRYLACPLVIPALLVGVVGRADGAGSRTTAPCGLQLSSGRAPGVPAFAIPAGGRERARRLAGGLRLCTLYRDDGSRFAHAQLDRLQQVLEMRFFRRSGALRFAVDTYHAATSSTSSSQVKCGSGAQASIGPKYWRQSFKWSIGTTTKGLDADKVVKAIRNAQSEWENNINWCNHKDQANVPSHYEGRTEKKAGLDGHNVVDWGSMTEDQDCSAALACTATWYDESGNPIESDIRFNTKFTWVIGTNTTGYDIQSVAAHEFGHVYQFDHVTNASNNEQTELMWPYLGTGNTSGHKLGKGDSKNINAHY